ncbi:MAG: hypothetical protein FGM37_10015 [Phycisphaerales bacterium]|nr:hypothetical protein [Phycisphaerales bacterium]
MNCLLRVVAPAAALALLLSPALVRPANAAPQLGQSAGFTEAFQPDFLARDMDLIVETLELEEWQRTILQSLLDDYQNDFRIGVDGLKDKLKAKGEEIKASGSRDAMGIIMGPIGEWSREKAMLKQRFLDNLRGQLSESQAARWDALDRAMLRDKELPRGVLSGESINLIAIARDMTISPEVADGSKPVLEEYSVALDEALRARASQMAQSQPIIQEAMVAQDWRKGLVQIEAIVARRVALRDVQDRYIDAIAAALGTAGADFRERALRTAYPQAYRPSPLIQFFASARALPGVTPEQLSALDAIEAAYVVSHVDLESRWAAAMRLHEPKAQLLDVQLRAAAAGGAEIAKPDSDPYRGLREERDRMNQKAHEDVAKVLGPELAELLPGGGDKARAERAAAARKDGSDESDGLGKSAGAKQRMKPEARDSGKEAVERSVRRPATSPGSSE